MTGLIGIYGVSGFGREVAPLVRQLAAVRGAELVFIDDSPREASCNGLLVRTPAEFAAHPATGKLVALAVADGTVRAALAERCAQAGWGFVSVSADNAVMLDANEIAEGAIFCPFSMVTSNARIGRHFHANIYSYIAHDCVIGDFVTFAPGVACNGNVTIGDGAYIGTNAVIRQGLTIGAGAVVGMGAVVTRDVPPGETWIGSPARKLER